MRVAYILDHFPRTSETFISDEIFSVHEAGIDYRVFAFAGSRNDAIHARARALVSSGRVEYCLPRSIIRDLLSVFYLGMRSPLKLARAMHVLLGNREQRWVARTALAIAETVKRDGISHLHAHFADKAAQVTMWVARWTGIPYTFTTHGYDIYFQPPTNMRDLVSEAKGMICVSQFNRAHVAKTFRVDPAKLHVIHCGIYLSEFAQPVRVPSAEMPYVKLLCVARLHPVKGHRFLLQAVRLLRDAGIRIRLELAGDGSLREELEARSLELGITECVAFLGPQSTDQVRALYARCDIVVLASESEGMPLVMMECMASGRVALATAVRGVPELVQDKVTGFLCPPKDAKAIADAVIWIVAHPSETQKISTAAQTFVAKNFDRTSCTRQLIKLWAITES